MAEYDEIAPKQRRTGYEAFRLANLGQSGGTMIGGRKGSGGKMRFNRSVAGTRDPGRAEERLRQQYASMGDSQRASWESRANDGDIRSGREMEAAADYEQRKATALMPPKMGDTTATSQTSPATSPAPSRAPQTLAQGAAMSATGQSYGAMAGRAMRTRRDDGSAVGEPSRTALSPSRGTINGVPTEQALTAAKASAGLAMSPAPVAGPANRMSDIETQARGRAAAIAAGTAKPRTAAQIAAGASDATKPLAVRTQTEGTSMLNRPDLSAKPAFDMAAETAKHKAALDAKANAARSAAIEAARKDGRIRPLPQRPEMPKAPELSAFAEWHSMSPEEQAATGKGGKPNARGARSKSSPKGVPVPTITGMVSDRMKMRRYMADVAKWYDENDRINQQRYGLPMPNPPKVASPRGARMNPAVATALPRPSNRTKLASR